MLATCRRLSALLFALVALGGGETLRALDAVLFHRGPAIAQGVAMDGAAAPTSHVSGCVLGSPMPTPLPAALPAMPAAQQGFAFAEPVHAVPGVLDGRTPSSVSARGPPLV